MFKSQLIAMHGTQGLACGLFCALMSYLAVPAHAQFTASPMESRGVTTDAPDEFDGVGITERLNETIPLDLEFTDEAGKAVKLREYFVPGRPVILTLNYYRCPMLCSLTLNGMVDALNELDWSAGKEFTIVTVSISPDEGPDLADVKKQAYLTQYRRESAKEGWRFLVGRQREIELLAQATGFGYRFDPKSGDYAHTSTIMFVTPDGRLSRYMNDVKFQPRDVRLALIEASEGAIGSPMDKFLLFMCFHYDPLRGSYAASAMKLMKMGGAMTLLLLATGVGVLWLRGSRHDSTGVAQPVTGTHVNVDTEVRG